MSKIINKQTVKYPYLSEPVKIIEFENGHKLVLAKKNSGMVNVSTWVKTGSINENDKNNGVSHFLEHLMFKGTTKYKAGEFDKTLERKGGIINAATWKDYTFYYVTIPKAHLELAISMHADMMVDPLLPEDEIGPVFNVDGEPPSDKRERYVVIEEIRMGEDRTWRKVYDKLNNAMYCHHPYKRNVIGTKEIISKIPQASIMDYYKNFYTPSNMTTIVVGEYDEQAVVRLVQQEFTFKEHSNFNKLTPDERIIETRIKNPVIIDETAEVKTGYIMFGFLCDSAKNLKETIALDLLSVILGEGRSSRFTKKFIEDVEKPHYYQIDTCHYAFKDGDNFFIEANFNPDYKDTVINEVKDELRRLNNITTDELKKAKKRVKINFAQEAETVSDIADSIGNFMTVCEDLSLAGKYLETLNDIDEQYLSEIALKYLSPDYCSISILMPDDTKEESV